MSVATQIAEHSCSFPFSYFSPKFLPFSLIDLSRVIPDHFGNCCSHKHTLSQSWGGRAWSRCRPKKEDWQPKKERNQRTPGRRSSQEDSALSESSCIGPGVATHTHHNTAYCSTLTHTHSLAEMPAEERRLAAEEGSYSKNTWPQKIARRIGWKRRAPVAGPCPALLVLSLSRLRKTDSGGEDWMKKIARGLQGGGPC
jgi:hypothetical protein